MLAAQLSGWSASATSAHRLVLVDQFEETFTLCHDEATRVAFIERLLALATPPGSPLGPSQTRSKGQPHPSPPQTREGAVMGHAKRRFLPSFGGG